MINFTCSQCGKDVQAPYHLAGKMGKCPACGARVHVSQAQEPKSVGSSAASPPPLPSMPPNDGTKACPYCGEEIKQVAIVCRFCGMNLVSGETTRMPGQGANTASPVSAAHVAERTLWRDNPTHWAYLSVYILGAFLIPLVIGIPIVIWAILDRKHTVYTVTNKRVTQKSGIIGKDLSEVDLKDIRNVLVKYGILDRLLGIGNIGLGTAAQAGIEIKMKGFRDPERIRKLIVDAKDRARELSRQAE